MKTEVIWKYSIPLSALANGQIPYQIEMPSGAQILSCHAQGEDICLWVRLSEETIREYRAEEAGDYPQNNPYKSIRTFNIIATGQPFREHEVGEFIGTCHFHGGKLVLHVFEAPRY